MAIFGKREEIAQPPAPPAQPAPTKAAAHSYGIADVIRLLRTLPVDQHADLVVRVIRTTLESVNVHVSDLVEDAARHQQKLGDRITALQAQILDLSKQIDSHRGEVARLESELAETTTARDRLLHAEQMAARPQPPPITPGTLPPPTPPPKISPSRPPEAHHGVKVS